MVILAPLGSGPYLGQSRTRHAPQRTWISASHFLTLVVHTHIRVPKAMLNVLIVYTFFCNTRQYSSRGASSMLWVGCNNGAGKTNASCAHMPLPSSCSIDCSR